MNGTVLPASSSSTTRSTLPRGICRWPAIGPRIDGERSDGGHARVCAGSQKSAQQIDSFRLARPGNLGLGRRVVKLAARRALLAPATGRSRQVRSRQVRRLFPGYRTAAGRQKKTPGVLKKHQTLASRRPMITRHQGGHPSRRQSAHACTRSRPGRQGLPATGTPNVRKRFMARTQLRVYYGPGTKLPPPPPNRPRGAIS